MSAESCPHCGTVATGQARFCSVCGASLLLHSDHPTLLLDVASGDTRATLPMESSLGGDTPGALAAAGDDEEKDVTPGEQDARVDEEEHILTSPSALAWPDLVANQPRIRQTQPISQAMLPAQMPEQQKQSASLLATVRGAGATQAVQPRMVNPMLQSPRPAAINMRRARHKGFPLRYFLLGTCVLLLAAIIAMSTYAFFTPKQPSVADAKTNAYVSRPVQTPEMQATTQPTAAPTLAPTATPVPIQAQPTTTGYAQPTAVPPLAGNPPAACLRTNTNILNFSATAGQKNPAPQAVTLTDSCASAPWSARTDVPWLSVTPASGNAFALNDSVKVDMNVNSANLAANSYTGNVVFKSGASQASVTVKLTVAPPAQKACIQVDQSNLSFSGTGQQSPARQPVVAHNCGSAGNLTASVSTTYTSSPLATQGQSKPAGPTTHTGGTPWLTVTGARTLAAGEALTLTVNANTSAPKLDPGTYTSSITVTITTSDGKVDTHIINVHLTVRH